MSFPVPQSVRHFGTGAEMSGQFGTSVEVSYGHFGTKVRSVLGPKCLYTGVSLNTTPTKKYEANHKVT